MGWIAAVIGAVGAIGGAAINSDSSRKASHAITDAQGIAEDTQYHPIDIAQLTQDAHNQAVLNATQSLALERALTPAIADTRQNLQQSVSDQLKLGGNLPPDVANQVTQAARVNSGISGTLGGSSVPLTAQMLGISALGLLNQRQNNASNLLANNPLPVSGIDPGSLASLEVNQNAAQNQFNLAKAGISTNLVNSGAQATAAQGGANAGLLTALTSSLTRQNQPSSGTDTSLLSKLFSQNNNPALNPAPAGGDGYGYAQGSMAGAY